MKYAILAIIVGALLACIIISSIPSTVVVDGSTHTLKTLARIKPDPALTPGATNPDITQGNIKTTICVPGFTSRVGYRPPSSYTTKLKKQQIAQYGYTDTNPADYEEDHLISLELGGNPTDPKNLWPEAYAEPNGAHTKDKVENALHKAVCNGTMSLKAAQTLIATDWTAYLQYTQ